MESIQKIKELQRMCGTYAVAKGLRRRGVPILVALVILAMFKE